MARLSFRHRTELVRFLADQPLLQTYRGRRQLLELAGLEAVLPQVDLEGPGLVAIGELVQVLEAYGRVTSEHEALGLFLNAVKETVGAAHEGREFLDLILHSYGLMTPVKTADFSAPWSGPVDLAKTEEKIIGENTLRHLFFLEKGLEAARPVAFVDVGTWTGTAFLIASDLVLTNHHVVADREQASRAVFRFNYQLNANGAENQVEEYRAAPHGLFLTDQSLDVSLIQLDEPAGDRWGTLRLSLRSPVPDQRVNIIQHPAGMPKQISLQNNFVQYADDRIVQYLTPTLGGSSGSPVFDDHWDVVAVHHAGGMLSEPGAHRLFFRNEGISAGAILRILPPDVRQRIQVVSA
ncbi:trypsin-like peptidase domain-containing protein [Nonomuraea sp. NPDC049709]|uniref:trypsin-like peptidase domain-containing protein n=1 Tax=Nonomuraea sp. NPDC049709 TaxID=3154736 RepID=UPI0034359416